MVYDVMILGGGPAGYSAALYAARAGLSTLLLERLSIGGQMTLTDQIDNYPGLPNGIDGYSLGQAMKQGAEQAGAKTVFAEILSVELDKPEKIAHTDSGDFSARSVIIATGAAHKHLGIAHEEDLTGRGVHYCASCDAMFYRNKTVVVVGGGNTAVGAARVLSRLSKRVILVHRRDSLRADRAEQNSLPESVEFRWNSAVSELLYEKRLTGLVLKNLQTGETEQIDCDGLFVSVGQSPNTELFRNAIALDNSGYITAGEDTKTNLPGVFAAGDVRSKVLRQVVTAASDGAVAAYMAEDYLKTAE